jgi:uncharacterized membrane protein
MMLTKKHNHFFSLFRIYKTTTMKGKIFLLSLTVVISLFIVSCSKGNGTGSGTGSGTGGGGGATTTPGPFFLSVRTVIQANCAVVGCHTGNNPQNGINFSNDNEIVVQKTRIKLRAVDQAGTANQMPPPPMAPLSASDQKKITDWITAGGAIAN